MKQLSDQELDRRISSLKKRLEQTATREANLRHHLLQGPTRQWTDEEMMESCEDAEKWLRGYGFKEITSL